jgi:hypothetical protein
MADDRNLCSLCIQDGTLRDWLERSSIEGDCDFDHDQTSVTCVSADELAEEADRWFQQYYQPGAPTIEVDPGVPRHRGEGRPYEEIFAEELGASDDVLKAVSPAALSLAMSKSKPLLCPAARP